MTPIVLSHPPFASCGGGPDGPCEKVKITAPIVFVRFPSFSVFSVFPSFRLFRFFPFFPSFPLSVFFRPFRLFRFSALPSLSLFRVFSFSRSLRVTVTLRKKTVKNEKNGRAGKEKNVVEFLPKFDRVKRLVIFTNTRKSGVLQLHIRGGFAKALYGSALCGKKKCPGGTTCGRKEKKRQSGGREEKRHRVLVLCCWGCAVQSCCHGECVGVRAECSSWLYGGCCCLAKVCTCERGWKRF